MSKDFELWFTVIFFGFFILTAISWISFAQFSMRPMERRMKAEGVDNNFQWDGLGTRITFYMFAIILPEKFALRLNRLIDVELVRSYAKKSDWWRGFIFCVVTNLWISLIFLGAILGYAE